MRYQYHISYFLSIKMITYGIFKEAKGEEKEEQLMKKREK